MAALIEGVVDPGGRASRRVAVDRLDLPVRLPEDLQLVEAQGGEIPGKTEDERQVLVGPLLPSARPDELEMGRQTRQVGARTLADPVWHPFHCVEPAGRGSR